ncbi:hypothetical protein KIPB_005062, partial [Kipferlia bialata]
DVISPSPVNPRLYGSAVERVGPHVYVFGGYDEGSEVFVSELHRYTVDTDTWETVGGLNVKEVKRREWQDIPYDYSPGGIKWPCPRGGCLSGCIDGLFFISAGNDNTGEGVYDSWVYDPSIGIWSEVVHSTPSHPVPSESGPEYTKRGTLHCHDVNVRVAPQTTRTATVSGSGGKRGGDCLVCTLYSITTTEGTTPCTEYVAVWSTLPMPFRSSGAAELSIPGSTVVVGGHGHQGKYHCLDTLSLEWSEERVPRIEGEAPKKSSNFYAGSGCMFGGDYESLYGVLHTVSGTMLVTVTEEGEEMH